MSEIGIPIHTNLGYRRPGSCGQVYEKRGHLTGKGHSARLEDFPEKQGILNMIDFAKLDMEAGILTGSTPLRGRPRYLGRESSDNLRAKRDLDS